MWFRLALKLGRTVAEVQAAMSAAEFGEWIAFYSIEPFGDRIEDIRMGTLAALTANINRGKGVEPYTPDDFAPWSAPPKLVAIDVKPPELVAMDVFGIDLVAKKKEGVRTFVIKRPTTNPEN